MRVIYLAHPYGGLPENRERAKRWFKWAVVHMRVSPVADWIVMTELLDESNREHGLACDVELVKRCDETEVSPGMKIEAEHARIVYDLTSLGREPPDGPVDGWVGKCVIKYDGDKVKNFSGVFLAEVAERLKPKVEGSRQMNLGANAVGRVVHFYTEHFYVDGDELRPRAAIIIEIVDSVEGLVCLTMFARGGTETFTAPFSDKPQPGHWTWRRDG